MYPSQANPETTMAKKTKKAAAGGINKMEAVRQAMAELGNAATRTDIRNFVKERTGVEMNLDVVSSYKSAVARASKKSATTTPEEKPVVQAPVAVTKKARKKRKRGKVAEKSAATVAPAASGNATGIALSDIQTVKELVGRVGVTTLKHLIELLGS
jgi:hypothetical protein